MNPWKRGGPPLELEPIGIVRSAFTEKVDAPRQPRAARDVPGRIELFAGHDFEHAVEDLEGWEYLWVIYWFHLNASWRPKVLPPRSTTGRKGVFSTRSPHRPNPIGLSAVRLERVDGLSLHVRDVDMLDGTPVLDLKPYVPYTDAHPGARSGWLETGDATTGPGPADPLTSWQVTLEPLAVEQADWVRERTGLALADRIVTTLALGPKPNPYRRIKREGDGYRLSIKDWRVRFVVDDRRIRVLAVFSGYRRAQLVDPVALADEAIRTHTEFAARWADVQS
jgi:tRNA-Thr(GGU) m(6)t(6)A37 methyltransferase TsaA